MLWIAIDDDDDHYDDGDDDDHNNGDDDKYDVCDMIGWTQTGKESDPQCATMG